MKGLVFLLAALIAPGLVWGEPEALEQLNQYRQTAGLEPLKRAAPLDRAAAAQAHYLGLGGRLDHRQDPGDPGYSGETPGQRALVAGWPARAVKENFSRGQEDWSASLSGLMAAIYHRFAFLSPEVDRIGLARAGAGPEASYVYVLGSQLSADLCQAAPPRPAGKARGLCGQGAWVPVKAWEKALEEKLAQAPRLVVWPAEGALVPPAFFEETPDPLPGRFYSGYPATVWFNPTHFTRPPEVVSLEWFDFFGRPVKTLPLMTAANDPNRLLEPSQVASFPLKRLDWGGQYRLVLRYRDQGRLFERRWAFQVSESRYSRLAIEGRGEWLALTPNHSFSLFLAPSAAFPFFGDLDWEALDGVAVELDWEDKNTLSLTPKGSFCDRIRFKLSGGRFFQVVLMPPGPEGPLSGAAPLCVPPRLQSKNGYDLRDQLKVPAQGSFWIRLPEAWAKTTQMSWSAPTGAMVELERVGEVLLQVKVQARSGQRLQILLPGKKPLTLQLSSEPAAPDYSANR